MRSHRYGDGRTIARQARNGAPVVAFALILGVAPPAGAQESVESPPQPELPRQASWQPWRPWEPRHQREPWEPSQWRRHIETAPHPPGAGVALSSSLGSEEPDRPAESSSEEPDRPAESSSEPPEPPNPLKSSEPREVPEVSERDARPKSSTAPAANERRAHLAAKVRVKRGKKAHARSRMKKRKSRAQAVHLWQQTADRAVRFAMRQRGKPYIWGGTGPRGYDCSGLVWRAWRRVGVQLPRTARSQYRWLRKHGKRVNRADLRPGDLVFFRQLGHVGMYIGDDRFVHAPRRGKSIGIRQLHGYYQRTYVGAGRPGWPGWLGNAT
jgi:cell wall-associated NlpC family hydrolase